ncbi:hypothetical protein OB955_17120 [Halobacteria archaeon AArc-m2/3/4]|uniref:DUF7119 domain-containing protein n=1 Tax=Natronoglomus mannanivorans TaxID=2979990 RepID=A0ABT2QHN8_9EURY|nr:hypothetical protein [Halobacteria archaeon AArc-m2/3/4]
MTDDRPDDRSRPRRDREPNHGRERERERERSIPTDRESPVGAPVIRGDESVTGTHARDAVQFDPDDPDSLQEAAETVYQFATGTAGSEDNLYMLRGAAACAALVRGEGSYKAAAERASVSNTGVSSEAAARTGDDAGTETDTGTDTGTGADTEHEAVSVSFIRKWARVHDLPQSVRRQVALGHIAPTAAKHIARVGGEARLLLAWATLDGDLTVREVRHVASAVNDGMAIDRALDDQGVTLGRLELTLQPTIYRDLRRQASNESTSPDTLVAEALDAYLE